MALLASGRRFARLREPHYRRYRRHAFIELREVLADPHRMSPVYLS
jgi:hypothetical protein